MEELIALLYFTYSDLRIQNTINTLTNRITLLCMSSDCLLAESFYCIHYLELELHCIDTINSLQENYNNVKLRNISIKKNALHKARSIFIVGV